MYFVINKKTKEKKNKQLKYLFGICIKLNLQKIVFKMT